MKSERVAIVGGGFSGTMAAAQLARRGIASSLIDGSGQMGNGVAYSTREPAHLLNVRAAAMSAWPDRPDDFARATGDGHGFAERRQFAAYLQGILAEAVASGLVEVVETMAVGAERTEDGWQVRLAEGRTIDAGALVLAQGNQAPEPMRVAERLSPERFINNPWGAEAKAALERLAESGGSVLILGTGLTMIDTVLSLNAAGHRGRIVALSRRGQLPRAHADFTSAPVEASEVPGGNVLALWRWLRRRSSEVGWRAAVDSLRPHSHALWQGLDEEQQHRFLRHARPWWDAHRHRIAPEVAQGIRELVGEGRLEVVAGRVRAMREEGDKVRVAIERRNSPAPNPSPEGEGDFSVVFNCTGPLGSLERTRDVLLRSLFDAGEVSIDRLGIALDVDGRSRAGERIWALGPMTKGLYWEIVAVPDIRGQAEAVAEDIATELT